MSIYLFTFQCKLTKERQSTLHTVTQCHTRYMNAELKVFVLSNLNEILQRLFDYYTQNIETLIITEGDIQRVGRIIRTGANLFL